MKQAWRFLLKLSRCFRIGHLLSNCYFSLTECLESASKQTGASCEWGMWVETVERKWELQRSIPCMLELCCLTYSALCYCCSYSAVIVLRSACRWGELRSCMKTWLFFPVSMFLLWGHIFRVCMWKYCLKKLCFPQI